MARALPAIMGQTHLQQLHLRNIPSKCCLRGPAWCLSPPNIPKKPLLLQGLQRTWEVSSLWGHGLCWCVGGGVLHVGGLCGRAVGAEHRLASRDAAVLCTCRAGCKTPPRARSNLREMFSVVWDI